MNSSNNEKLAIEHALHNPFTDLADLAEMKKQLSLLYLEQQKIVAETLKEEQQLKISNLSEVKTYLKALSDEDLIKLFGENAFEENGVVFLSETDNDLLKKALPEELFQKLIDLQLSAKEYATFKNDYLISALAKTASQIVPVYYVGTTYTRIPSTLLKNKPFPCCYISKTHLKRFSERNGLKKVSRKDFLTSKDLNRSNIGRTLLKAKDHHISHIEYEYEKAYKTFLIYHIAQAHWQKKIQDNKPLPREDRIFYSNHALEIRTDFLSIKENYTKIATLYKNLSR